MRWCCSAKTMFSTVTDLHILEFVAVVLTLQDCMNFFHLQASNPKPTILNLKNKSRKSFSISWSIDAVIGGINRDCCLCWAIWSQYHHQPYESDAIRRPNCHWRGWWWCPSKTLGQRISHIYLVAVEAWSFEHKYKGPEKKSLLMSFKIYAILGGEHKEKSHIWSQFLSILQEAGKPDILLRKLSLCLYQYHELS